MEAFGSVNWCPRIDLHLLSSKLSGIVPDCLMSTSGSPERSRCLKIWIAMPVLKKKYPCTLGIDMRKKTFRTSPSTTIAYASNFFFFFDFSRMQRTFYSIRWIAWCLEKFQQPQWSANKMHKRSNFTKIFESFKCTYLHISKVDHMLT